MKKISLFLLLLTSLTVCQAQPEMWVFFTDKGTAVASQLAHPGDFLSPAAIAMRIDKGVALTEADLPVHAPYLDALRSAGYDVQGSSRWLNAAIVQADAEGAAALRQLDFVSGLRPMATFTRHATDEPSLPMEETQGLGLAYGAAEVQNNMLNIAPFHDRGFTGRGVRVAILDAGFPGVDTIAVFDSLRRDGRIIATYDFVDDTSFVYGANSHGTNVLSTIAANLPGKLVGTAPHVSVILCRTEDAGSETEIEEKYFMQAVEFADSIGVDVLHASLGYTKFDDDIGSHKYEDLDGDMAIATRAVDMAAQRGIIVTISAGNEGSNSWRYIAVPCDADSILCVGAVDSEKVLASFSSVGPTADGRTKPDVVAMGSYTAVASPRGRIVNASGTSFSGPLMAGVMACLRQAHPERVNMDLIQAVRLSGDQSQFPDNEYGYGIPNVVMADSLLTNFSDLTMVEIPMAAKPERTRPMEVAFAPEKEKKAIIFTEDPKTEFTQKRKKLLISTEMADAVIRDVTLYRDEQALTIDPKDIAQNPYDIKVKTKWFLPGDYYFHVTTGQFEEFIPFTIE
jgi:subtilisin family serine protease